MFERRTRGGAPSLDRRKTYVDIMERVLGTSLPFIPAEQPSLPLSEITFTGSTAVAAVSDVQIVVLYSIVPDLKR
jgi:hypothetical protein